MIIEVEDRFCKAAKQFLRVLQRIQGAAASGDAVREVEETAWFGLIELGREMIVAYIKQQEEEGRLTGESYAAVVQRLPQSPNEKGVSGPIPKSLGISWGGVLAIGAAVARLILVPFELVVRHGPGP